MRIQSSSLFLLFSLLALLRLCWLFSHRLRLVILPYVARSAQLTATAQTLVLNQIHALSRDAQSLVNLIAEETLRFASRCRPPLITIKSRVLAVVHDNLLRHVDVSQGEVMQRAVLVILVALQALLFSTSTLYLQGKCSLGEARICRISAQFQRPPWPRASLLCASPSCLSISPG